MNIYSDDELNSDEDAPEMPYDGENINNFSNNEENIYEVAPKSPTNDKIMISSYDMVTPDIPTNGVNDEIIDNDEEKDNNKTTEKEKDNES